MATQSWSSAAVSNLSHTKVFSSLSFAAIHFFTVYYCTKRFLVRGSLHGMPRFITELSSKLHFLCAEILSEQENNVRILLEIHWKMSSARTLFQALYIHTLMHKSTHTHTHTHTALPSPGNIDAGTQPFMGVWLLA